MKFSTTNYIMTFFSKKGLLTGLIPTIVFGNAWAQSGIVAGGGNMTNEEGSLSCSIGQVDFKQKSSADGQVNAGIQQAAGELSRITHSSDEEYVGYGISAYPNPTKDNVLVTINDAEEHAYTLTNVEGKLIQQGKMTRSAQLSLADQAIGTYLLKITTKINEEEFIIIKIIKE